MSDWDATEYDRVSQVQLAWGKNVLARRAWQGNETVLDAGCGSGGLTRLIADRVYAVDKDPDMVHHAREKLADCKNVEVIQSDLAEVKLPEQVDVVFSNAVLHWVMDHGKAFANFYMLLKEGGELVAQCGGQGNLEKAIAILDGIAAKEPFSAHFAGWQKPWNFAGPKGTETLLRQAGFGKASAHLSSEPATFASRDQFSSFVKTVVMWPYLSRLPSESRERFLEAYLDGCKEEWVLDYVRLNISAQK